MYEKIKKLISESSTEALDAKASLNIQFSDVVKIKVEVRLFLF